MLRCECCGGNKDLKLGAYTLFSEYEIICENCLGKLMEYEMAPSPLEVAKARLDALQLADEDIYGFFAEDGNVVVEYLLNRHLVKCNLVACDDDDEAWDVVLELC